jgi:hypothetical protein
LEYGDALKNHDSESRTLVYNKHRDFMRKEMLSLGLFEENGSSLTTTEKFSKMYESICADLERAENDLRDEGK